MSAVSLDTPLETQPRLVCENVTVRFGGVVALQSVGLTLPPASIVGLVGPNGAGKSTLFSVLSGLRRPHSGSVHLEGVDITSLSPQSRARRGLARTFQHPEIFSDLTVREHVVLSYRMRHSRGRVWSDIITGRGFRPADKTETASVNQLIELLDLGPVAHRRVTGLSLGTTRLVELARALALAPRVLLLDEPSSGLDAQETDQVVAVFRRSVEVSGVSLLIVEHDVAMVLGMCSYVHVLDFGVKIGAGTPDEIRANKAVQVAYLGEESPSVEDGQG